MAFGQTISENITADEPIQYLLNPMEELEILDGDGILLSSLLVKQKGCADNVEVWLTLVLIIQHDIQIFTFIGG